MRKKKQEKITREKQQSFRKIIFRKKISRNFKKHWKIKQI